MASDQVRLDAARYRAAQAIRTGHASPSVPPNRQDAADATDAALWNAQKHQAD